MARTTRLPFAIGDIVVREVIPWEEKKAQLCTRVCMVIIVCLRKRDRKRERTISRYDIVVQLYRNEPAIQDEYGHKIWLFCLDVCVCMSVYVCVYMKKKEEKKLSRGFPLLPYPLSLPRFPFRRASRIPKTSLLFSHFSEENARQGQPRD